MLPFSFFISTMGKQPLTAHQSFRRVKELTPIRRLACPCFTTLSMDDCGIPGQPRTQNDFPPPRQAACALRSKIPWAIAVSAACFLLRQERYLVSHSAAPYKENFLTFVVARCVPRMTSWTWAVSESEVCGLREVTQKESGRVLHAFLSH